MAFFIIQNHEVKIRNEEASVTPVIIGDVARSFNGKPLTTRRAIVKDWTLKTPPISPVEGEFLLALLQGQGHTWDFDASATNDEYLYSSKGLGPDSMGTISRNTAVAKFGAAGVGIAAGDQVSWDVGYDFEWTVMVWKQNFNGVIVTGSTHYIVNSAGDKWVDGVQNNAANTDFIDVTNGVLTLGDATSIINSYFDDLVIIEADITDEWATDFGQMLTAFSALPKIEIRGDVCLGHRFRVECTDVEFSYIQGYLDGTWYPNLMEIEFSMHEFSRES